jgi:hypothetical protein
VRGCPGYFRVGRTLAGQWWLIDPRERAFFSRGVTSINRAGTQGGRYARPGPYATQVDRLHGTDSPEPFVNSVLTRLAAWNFNTLGAWTTPEFFDRGVPYTEIIEFTKASGAPLLADPLEPARSLRVVDVFDPAWPRRADALAAELAAPRRDSRDLIGYFTDNEIGFLDAEDQGLWGQTRPEAALARPRRASLLQTCLAQEPSRAAHRSAWAHALAPYDSDLAALGRAWGLGPLRDAAQLAALTAAGTVIDHPAYLYDNHTFVREYARRYFVTTAAAIRRHDPHHLILGIRFGGPPGRAVLESCVAPHVDVLSANNYRDNLRERIDLYAEATGMPVLIGEFAWASGYFLERAYAGAPADLPQVTRMHRMGRHTLEHACSHPHLVGYTWYRWVQGDPTDPRPSDHGLVLTDDSPHPHHPCLAQLINARTAALRLGLRPPYDQVRGGDPLSD